MKLQSWKEAVIAAKALHSWLAQHCPSCGKRHTQMCIDGGRCVQSFPDGTPCGKMLCNVSAFEDAVKESEFLTNKLTDKASTGMSRVSGACAACSGTGVSGWTFRGVTLPTPSPCTACNASGKRRAAAPT